MGDYRVGPYSLPTDKAAHPQQFALHHGAMACLDFLVNALFELHFTHTHISLCASVNMRAHESYDAGFGHADNQPSLD